MSKFLTKFMLLLTLFGPYAHGQKFMKSDSYKTLYKNCHENHKIILKDFISNTNFQLNFILDLMTKGPDSFETVLASERFDFILSELIVEKAILDDLMAQMNRTHLETYINNPKNEGKNYLSTEDMAIDLDTKLPLMLKNFSQKFNSKQIELMKGATQKYLIKEASKSVASKGAKSIGSGALVGLISAQKGSLLLRSFYLNLGGKILTTAGVAVLLDILTLPLKGGRYPPHTLWIKVLKKYPTLMVIPELMIHAGIEDHPWGAHCQALNQSPSLMEDLLKQALLEKNQSFYQRTDHLRFPFSELVIETDMDAYLRRHPIKEIEQDNVRTRIPPR